MPENPSKKTTLETLLGNFSRKKAVTKSRQKQAKSDETNGGGIAGLSNQISKQCVFRLLDFGRTFVRCSLTALGKQRS